MLLTTECFGTKLDGCLFPFFFEPSYDFKMCYSFLNKSSKNKGKTIFFEKFLNKSLKKFVEYQRED